MDSRVLKFQGLGFRDSRVQTFSVSGFRALGLRASPCFVVLCFIVVGLPWLLLIIVPTSIAGNLQRLWGY